MNNRNYRISFLGKDNYGKNWQEYIDKIVEMNDEDLLKTTEHVIWLSAYAANNPSSDYHTQAAICKEEWQYRNQPDMFNIARKKAFS